jgi:ABC-type multidrug transport system fused ATPase/permease subunit
MDAKIFPATLMAFLVPIILLIIFVKTSQSNESIGKKNIPVLSKEQMQELAKGFGIGSSSKSEILGSSIESSVNNNNDIRLLNINGNKKGTSKSANENFVTESLINLHQLWPMFYFFSVVMTYMSYTWPGMLLKIKEDGTKMRQFLMTSKGKQKSYLFAFIFSDLLVSFLAFFVLMIVCKLLCFGWADGWSILTFSTFELNLIFTLTLYQLSQLFVIGYLVANIFKTEKSLMTWHNLLSLIGFGVLCFLSWLSFDARVMQMPNIISNSQTISNLNIDWWKTGLNYLCYPKLAINMLISKLPLFVEEIRGTSNSFSKPIKDRILFFSKSNQEVYGGWSFNFLLLTCHNIAYFLIWCYVDKVKFSFHTKKDG